MNRVALGLAALAVTSVVAGCGSSSSGGDNPVVTGPTGTAAASSSKVPGCSPSTIQTHTAGTLTFGVDNPVFPPWFVGNDPMNGKGFEGAMIQAVATELGYDASHIAYNTVKFNQAISPAPKSFDLDFDEFSIRASREKVVDFSSPYYDVNEAVIAVKGTKGANVTTLAGLQSLKLGAQIGTTNETTITDVIKPSQSPGIYNTNSLALQALKNQQIDGLLLDLPTAFYVTGSGQVPNSTVVGQLPAGSQPEQFGALLAKGSPVTSCVSKAIDALKADGTIAQIQDKWLSQVAKAPVLQ
jgi:polar amino acid transport system substrate-binding protein